MIVPPDATMEPPIQGVSLLTMYKQDN